MYICNKALTLKVLTAMFSPFLRGQMSQIVDVKVSEKLYIISQGIYLKKTLGLLFPFICYIILRFNNL
jgi:hypothetical protein